MDLLHDYVSAALGPSCAQTLVVDMDMTDAVCMKLLLSKVLGSLVVLGSLIVKVPQIISIMRAGSVKGLSLSMYTLELVAYTISFAYNFQSGYSFSTYGENVFIAAQNIAIIALYAVYGSGSKPVFVLGFAAYGAAAYALVSGLVDMATLTSLAALNIPISASSKVPQILSNFSNKSTGTLSIVTCLLNFVGSLARVFTTLQEVNDALLLGGFVLMTVLNGTLFFQILYFGSDGRDKSKKKKNE